MVRQLSYTKYENEILPEFRQKLNQAESTEDVKKFFTQSIRILFEKILERKVILSNEDMTLIIDKEPHYKIARQFQSSEELNALLKDSDLSNVLNRLAKAAVKRYLRLDRHLEKTSSKIRM